MRLHSNYFVVVLVSAAPGRQQRHQQQQTQPRHHRQRSWNRDLLESLWNGLCLTSFTWNSRKSCQKKIFFSSSIYFCQLRKETLFCFCAVCRDGKEEEKSPKNQTNVAFFALVGHSCGEKRRFHLVTKVWRRVSLFADWGNHTLRQSVFLNAIIVSLTKSK